MSVNSQVLDSRPSMIEETRASFRPSKEPSVARLVRDATAVLLDEPPMPPTPNVSRWHRLRRQKEEAPTKGDEAPPKTKVNMFSAFKYADRTDFCLIAAGNVCAGVVGVLMPLNMLFMGNDHALTLPSYEHVRGLHTYLDLG